MKPIGLVFVIINLVLAAAFLGYSAFALREADSAQSRMDELQNNYDSMESDLNSRINTAMSQLNTVGDERQQKLEQLNTAQALIADLEGRLAEANRQNDELTAQVGGINSSLTDVSGAVDQATERAARSEEARRAAEQDRDAALDEAAAATTAQRDAEAALASANNMIADLETSLTEARGSVSSLTNKLALVADQAGVDIDGLIDQPLVRGRVLQVKNDVQPGLVALNVGTEAGVTRGMTFEIYSGGSYKGQVQVETVLEGRCSALVVTAVGEMRQGDQASTQL